MKLNLVTFENLSKIKTNLDDLAECFRSDSSQKLEEKLGGRLFTSTRFDHVNNFELDTSAEKPFLTDAENVRKVFWNLRFLTVTQASDERLWAALCLGPFWHYVKYRWNIDNNCVPSNIKQHFMFGYGTRRSLTRNALSRLWWIGRLTYDEERSDKWELTNFVCESSANVMHILERNTSNNPAIIRPFLSAVIEARKKGFLINTNIVGELSKYLNLLGGTYILDCLTEKKIHDKIFDKARELSEKAKEDENT